MAVLLAIIQILKPLLYKMWLSLYHCNTFRTFKPSLYTLILMASKTIFAFVIVLILLFLFMMAEPSGTKEVINRKVCFLKAHIILFNTNFIFSRAKYSVFFFFKSKIKLFWSVFLCRFWKTMVICMMKNQWVGISWGRFLQGQILCITMVAPPSLKHLNAIGIILLLCLTFLLVFGSNLTTSLCS